MAILNACGSTGTSSTSATSAAVTAAVVSTSPAATTAATTGPASTATAGTAATSEATAAAPTPATSTTGQDAIPAIVAAANAFLATLDDTQKSSVVFDWTDTEQKQRWSNLPEGLFERAGLMMGDLSEDQQNASLAVLQAILSTEGYNRLLAAWNADEALTSSEGGGGPGGGQLLFGKQYYWVAIIGTPSETDPWQYQWGGHHFTVNTTIAGSNISLTPSFIGV